METDFQLQEIGITYSHKIKLDEREKIISSYDANKAFRMIWNESLEHRESAYLMLLDEANSILGYHFLSYGGLTSTVVDVRIIMQVALKSNASGIILAHNHPSGQLKPSKQDRDITDTINDACKIMTIRLLDHLIITPESYWSFGDNGEI